MPLPGSLQYPGVTVSLVCVCDGGGRLEAVHCRDKVYSDSLSEGTQSFLLGKACSGVRRVPHCHSQKTERERYERWCSACLLFETLRCQPTQSCYLLSKWIFSPQLNPRPTLRDIRKDYVSQVISNPVDSKD